MRRDEGGEGGKRGGGEGGKRGGGREGGKRRGGEGERKKAVIFGGVAKKAVDSII